MTRAAGNVTAQDVREVVFPKPPVGRRGYDAAYVDELLVRIAAAIDALPDPQ